MVLKDEADSMVGRSSFRWAVSRNIVCDEKPHQMGY